MCVTCGCGSDDVHIEAGTASAVDRPKAEGPANSHAHSHAHGHDQSAGHAHDHPHGPGHEHPHAHDHGSHWHSHDEGTFHSHDDGTFHSHEPPAGGMTPARRIQVERDILARNGAVAARNRERLAGQGIFALNLVSSPGSGKTTLLVRTIEALAGRMPIAVIEGDQQTRFDADRIRATGAPAIQINTGKGCHLDATMVATAIDRLAPADDLLLMIENVGNLVCPSAFDLGEAHKVVVLSVTEGEDKPLKYPDMFAAASLLLLNKVDLLPHLDFDVARCLEFARRVNPTITILQVSARTGAGMDAWLDWLAQGAARSRTARQDTVAALRRRVAELEAQAAGRAAH
ncbi:MAG TPA: hydrogenase nickel incorporation protein HypB [Caldimonas sp.]|nr:hydrogenase nickel incorporation protein HypB [Caldimonas sp.]